MSKKDTVIIAALVNTGLLALVFMLATTTDIEVVSGLQNVDHSIVETERTAQIEEKTMSPLTQIASKDELDEVLKNYAQAIEVPPVPKDEAKPIEAAKPDEKYVDVTVKRGDSLDKIARANGTSVAEIMKINQLKNERLDIGQVLRVAVTKKKDTPAKANPIAMANTPSKGPEYYTMKSGDSPWKIAKDRQVPFEQLLKLNNLDEAKARNLKPGDVLRIK